VGPLFTLLNTALVTNVKHITIVTCVNALVSSQMTITIVIGDIGGQNLGKIIFGQVSLKIPEFSGKYHAKFLNFVTFFVKI